MLQPEPFRDQKLTPITRLGLLLGSRTIPAWQVAAIEQVQRLLRVEISIVLTHDGPSVRLPRPVMPLWRLCERHLYRRAGRSAGDPLELVDARGVLPHSEWIQLGACERNRDRGLPAQLASRQLDAILQLGCGHFHPVPARLAREGLLFFRHAGILEERAGYGAAAAICAGASLVETRLELLTPNGIRLLGSSATAVASHSLRLTAGRCYWRAAQLLARHLGSLLETRRQ
jgi:hypothetical protein